MAKGFASAGAGVMAVDFAADAGEDLVRELDGSGHTYRALDLSDVTTHKELIEAARHSLGEVYALVQLAAVLRRRVQLRWSDVQAAAGMTLSR